jgi:hypothetical protein
LEESQNNTENWENHGKSKNASVEIPLFMQNKVAADESSQDDYEDIPVEGYGIAMLRGMGFKANEGIGLRNKGVITPLQVTARPGLGLGLGAATPKVEKIVLRRVARHPPGTTTLPGRSVLRASRPVRLRPYSASGPGSQRSQDQRPTKSRTGRRTTQKPAAD